MTPEERFRTLWEGPTPAPGSMVPAEALAAVAQFWFVRGMELAAKLVQEHRHHVRMVRGQSGEYVRQVDVVATLRSLHEEILGPCPRPDG